MYFFTLDSSDRFVKAISVLNRVTEYTTLIVSADMVSLTSCHHSAESVVSFHMMPPFFTRFFSSHTHKSLILLQPFRDLLLRMQRSHFSSLALYVNNNYSHKLQFRNPSSNDHEGEIFNRGLLVGGAALVQPLSQIDMATFFSIDLLDFNLVLMMFRGSIVTGILVSLTDSHVKFSFGSREVIFTKKDKRCIIGGTIEKEISLMIAVTPTNITVQSERVWFFKNAEACTYMIAPTGLFEQYTVRFPFVC